MCGGRGEQEPRPALPLASFPRQPLPDMEGGGSEPHKKERGIATKNTKNAEPSYLIWLTSSADFAEITETIWQESRTILVTKPTISC